MNLDFKPHFAKDKMHPFPERIGGTHPHRGSSAVAPEEILTSWDAIKKQPMPHNKNLVYIHIPFCETHCTFCGFYQNKLKSDSTERYVEYLLKEIDMEVNSPMHQSAPIRAVYFGGGTPTAMSAQELYKVVKKLRDTLPLANDCEITMEGRVYHFDEERIDACLDAGVNRFSIGIQTFDTFIRRKMARKNSKEEIIVFLQMLGGKDRAAVVCDLLYGLPYQTMETWKEDLQIIDDLPLDGVDLYALTLIPSTALYQLTQTEKIKTPDVLERKEYYVVGKDFLYEKGWSHISNNHWARSTRERNRYNLLIKQGAGLIALGSGAGGFLNNQSYMIERGLDKYYERIDKGEKPIAYMSIPQPKSQWQYRLQSGLEVGYLDLEKIIDKAYLLQPLIAQWHEAGLLKDDKLGLKLTTDGRYWVNNIASSLRALISQILADEKLDKVS